MNKAKPVEVILECKHVLTFRQYAWAPRKGERVWCPRCADMRRVGTAPPEYRAKCQQCSYGRATGSDERQAYRLARQHHERRQHAVDVRDGRVTLDTVGTRQPVLDAPEIFQILSTKGVDTSRLRDP